MINTRMEPRHSFFVLSMLFLYALGMLVFYLMSQKMSSMEVAYTEKMTTNLENILGL